MEYWLGVELIHEVVNELDIKIEFNLKAATELLDKIALLCCKNNQQFEVTLANLLLRILYISIYIYVCVFPEMYIITMTIISTKYPIDPNDHWVRLNLYMC